MPALAQSRLGLAVPNNVARVCIRYSIAIFLQVGADGCRIRGQRILTAAQRTQIMQGDSSDNSDASSRLRLSVDPANEG
jgi:hypothetical protein